MRYRKNPTIPAQIILLDRAAYSKDLQPPKTGARTGAPLGCRYPESCETLRRIEMMIPVVILGEGHDRRRIQCHDK
ncbi:hypothetical protein SPHINGOAX6_70822 [Sphingomonas sp. AX6]|nr:hypothetical protein SPHINGOAX6_70822 [Sphingomonas sp. AX6]